MRMNTSPWLNQLDALRTPERLTKDIGADVCIVGAGIAGVATAFFALKHTSKAVVMLERGKLAHGATGRNAGQVVSYFERGFASIAEEFGLTMAAEGEKAVDDAWELLDEMYTDAGLEIPFSRFLGHGGLSSYEQVLWHLKNNKLRREAGRPVRRLIISEAAPFARDIPAEYESLYFLVPKAEIRTLLETELDEFVAVLSHQKGCINSALFCQEIVAYLGQTYGARFALYEHTPVEKIVLRHGYALLDADTNTVTARSVVLCTNGFEDLHIFNETGLDIDARYHHLVSGKVGYMSGYLEAMNKPPTAVSYYTDPLASVENSYYYLTRRPYEYEKGTKHNLICIGGPDENLAEDESYSHEDEYPEDAIARIDQFVHRVYDIDPNKRIDYIFTWHGLMGYTRNGIRMAGPEPQNPVLLYNLGCNGVGILPSIHGGRKIARHLAGEKVEKSIFDVPAR